MKFLNRFVKNIKLNLLGRWSINYDVDIINKKIDQSNVDHCGCCSNLKPEKKITKLNSDEYLIPFFN